MKILIFPNGLVVAVYLHDDAGGGRSVAAAAMRLLLGRSLPGNPYSGAELAPW
jgi:hypothetical protein